MGTAPFSNPCSSPFGSGKDGRLIETDVVIDETLSMGTLDELSNTLGARETIIHEFGHVLGMEHDDDNETVMCTYDSCGKVAARGVAASGSVWGNRTEMILPEDVDFAVDWHGSTTPGIKDPTASGWSRTSGSPLSRIYGSGELRELCPGATTTVKISAGNVGAADIPSSAPVTYHIVMSSNNEISVADTLVATGSFYMSVGGWGTPTASIVVPNLTPGNTYWVGVMADPAEAVAEEDENNNSTKTGLRIKIKSSGC